MKTPATVDAVEVSIPSGSVSIIGNLHAHGTSGMVVFAHGSGSGRNSPRNVEVARRLQQAGFSTLLVDLLSPHEAAEDERTARLRFDIPLLAERMIAATDWLGTCEPPARPIAYFGASTGAAAALIAAAQRPDKIASVVSRGGRPDLAGSALAAVYASVLLLVGSRDHHVLALNRSALAALIHASDRHLRVIQGASHLFEEPGTLDQVAEHAVEWFKGHLRRALPRT